MSEKKTRFAMVPHSVLVGYELDNNHIAYYLWLKMLCGEDGTCYRSLRKLSELTGFSIGQLSKMNYRLHSLGLIHATKQKCVNEEGKEKKWPVWHISIVDIWQKNALHFAQDDPTNCSPDEHIQSETVHQMNTFTQSVQDMNRKPKSVHTVNNSVHTVNTSAKKCSCSDNNKEDTIDITEEESVSSNIIEKENDSFGASAHADDAIHTILTLQEENCLLREQLALLRAERQTPRSTTETLYHIASETMATGQGKEAEPAFDAPPPVLLQDYEHVANGVAIDSTSFPEQQSMKVKPIGPSVPSVMPTKIGVKTDGATLSASQKETKQREKNKKVVEVPVMPEDTAAWNAETLVQVLEARQGRRYPNGAKRKSDRVRDKELAAAGDLVDMIDIWTEQTATNIKRLLLIVDHQEQRKDGWWLENVGHVMPHHLAEKDRIHAMIDEMKRQKQQGSVRPPTSKPDTAPIYIVPQSSINSFNGRSQRLLAHHIGV